MKKTNVAVVGATGETGSSIVEALLDTGNFEITALTRPESLSKPANDRLRERSVHVRQLDLAADHATLIDSLRGVDTVIVAISPYDYRVQIPLATAAKEAGVQRFVPSSFTSVAPAGGVLGLRDEKEEVYQHLRNIKLPYTVIDVGWWYQGSLPRVPSGKLDHVALFSKTEIAGDGNVPSAITDQRDVGRYVARIIQDARTIDNFVMAYNELWSANEVFAKVEEITGETLKRLYISEDELRAKLDRSVRALNSDPTNGKAAWDKVTTEYQLSMEILGDNTPESAKALGYITSKELYPDFKFTRFEDVIRESLEGGGYIPYQSNEKMKEMMREFHGK